MSPRTSASDAPQRTLFLSKADYAAGADSILAMAQRQVDLFDPDFSEFRLESPSRIGLLDRFLRLNRGNRVRIAVHDAEHVQRYCPRLIGLLALHSPNLVIHRTIGEAARVQDCFVLVDRLHVVRRPVAAQGRGVLLLNDTREGLGMHERFSEIWDSSEPGVSASTSGL